LPRLDEYDRVVRGDGDLNVVDLPSDIKTVAYYVASSNNTSSTTASTALPNSLQERETFDPNIERTLRSSLMRRSLDRAVTQYAIEVGDFDKLSAAGELLAPEVVAIEFRYSDGVEWFDEWNTASAGSLPVAVQVAIAIDMHAEDRAELPDHTTSILTDEQHELPQEVVYRLLVHLPAAEAPTEEEQLSDEELFP
jgi:hypothetical protein